jgi:hypothetical protein
MQFHEQRTLWASLKPSVKKNMSCDDFYSFVASSTTTGWALMEVMCEHFWYSAGSPYYKIYPAIIPMFTSLKLDIETKHIRLPLDHLSIRFPDPSPLGFDCGGKHWQIRTILATNCDPAIDPAFRFEKGGRGISLWIDWGETHPDVPEGFTYRAIATGETILLGDETTMEERLDSSPHVEGYGAEPFDCPREIIKDCFRIVCTLCLLGNNPEIIEPDWLKADEGKISGASAEDLKRFARRATARKGRGWRVGAKIEKVPHFRRPHPALLRVGHGRTERKLVWRSGSVVHRDIVKAVPSGYQADEWHGCTSA